MWKRISPRLMSWLVMAVASGFVTTIASKSVQ